MSSVFVCLFRLQRRACTDNQPRCHTATALYPVILVLKLMLKVRANGAARAKFTGSLSHFRFQRSY